jgi:hypothetical protein
MVIFVSRFGVNIPSIVKIPVKIKLFAFFAAWHSDCRRSTRRLGGDAREGKERLWRCQINQQFRVMGY